MNAGRAVFEAVGNFRSLQREANQTADALDRTKQSAQQMGEGLPGPAEEKRIRNVGDRAAELGGKMQRTGTKMTLGMTTPLTLFGTQAIRTFSEFEKSLVSAQLKSGATEKQFARMKDLALELGASTTFSSSEAAGAMDLLAASGMDAEQAMKALPGVMKGAQASGEGLALTADTVAKAINAFGLEASDATMVSDVFAQAANTTALGMQEIAQGMAGAGEVGSRFGQDMTGVVAMLGRLVDQGVPAASAGVAIRQALSSMATPTDKAAKHMENLGIKVRDAEGNMKQIPDLMAEMSAGLDLQNPKLREAAKAAGKTGQEYRDMALKQMFGVEGAKAVSLAISDGKPMMLDAQKDTKKLADLTEGLAQTMGKDAAEAWVKARTENGKFVATGADTVKALDAMGRASEGTSEKFGKAFSKTTSAKLDALMGSIETLAITLVDSVAPALTTVVDGITAFVNVLGKVAKIPFVGPLVIGLGVLLAALGPIMIVVGTLLKSFRTLAQVGGKIKNIGKGKGAGPAGGAPAVVGGGGDGGSQSVFWTRPMPVYMVSGPGGKGGAKGKGGKGGGVVAGGGRGATKPPKAGAHKGPRGGGGKGALAGAGAAGATGGIFAALTGGGAGEIAKSVALFAGIELAIMGIGKAFGKIMPMVSRFGGFIARLGPLFLRVIPFILRFLGPIGLIITAAILVIQNWDRVKAFLIASWNAIKSAAAAVWGTIKMLVIGAWNGIRAAAIGVWNGIRAFVIGVWNAIRARAVAVWNGIRALIGAAIRGAAAVIRSVLASIRAVWSATWNALKAIASAIWNGIKAVVSAAINFVKGVIQRGVATIKAIWGRLRDLGSVVSAAFGAVKAAVGSAIDWCIGKVQEFLGAIGRIGGAISGAVGKMKDLGGKAASILPGLRTGGLVGGTGKGDKYPHLLEAGEFVIRSAVVRQPGVLEALQRLNKYGSPGKSGKKKKADDKKKQKKQLRTVGGRPIAAAQTTGKGGRPFGGPGDGRPVATAAAAMGGDNWKAWKKRREQMMKMTFEGKQWAKGAMSSLAYQQMQGKNVNHGMQVPKGAFAAPPVNVKPKQVTWAPVIQNPTPEPASTSLFKTAQKVAYLGLDGGDDD